MARPTPTPPSTATTRPPLPVMMITIRLRRQEEAAPPPPPPAAPTVAGLSTLRFRGGSVDVGRVPPPAPEGCPLSSAAAGVVDGERIRTTTTRLSSEDERLTPPPTPASRATTIPLRPNGEVPTDPLLAVAYGDITRPPGSAPSAATRAAPHLPPSTAGAVGEGDSEAEEEGLPPPPPTPTSPTPGSAPSSATRSAAHLPPSAAGALGEGDSEAEEEGLPPPPTPTSPTLLFPSEDIRRGTQSVSAISWGDLPADLVLLVACRQGLSRQDVERMRGVCRVWRELIPSTIDPVLVLSRRSPGPNSEIILMEIKRSNHADDATFQHKVPLVPPPTAVSCWGSALGLIGLQHGNSQEISAYCIYCARSKQMLSLPAGAAPKALFLEPLTPQRFLVMALAADGDSVLRVDGDGYPWALEGAGPSWLPTQGFGDMPIRSMALSPGILRAGVSGDSVIIIDESGRPMDAQIDVMQLQTPPLYLMDGTLSGPWKENGQHLFLCEEKLYFAEIFDILDAPEGARLRLFTVQRSAEEEYALIPVSDIGNYSVYLGPNQSFVIPSAVPLVGRLPNTIYVEDYRGDVRRPRVIAINIRTQEITAVPFPAEISPIDEDWMLAVWVGLPQQKDLVNHCKSGECWGFWD